MPEKLLKINCTSQVTELAAKESIMSAIKLHTNLSTTAEDIVDSSTVPEAM